MIEEELMAIKEQNSRIERMLRTLIGESKPDLDPRRFMNIPEAAAATGLSIVTLRSYCNRGQIRHTKMGRRVIIHTDSLYEYIAENARKTIRERAEEQRRLMGR